MGGIPPALRGEQSSDGVTFSDVHQKGVMWPPPPPHKSRVAERPECFTLEGCWRQLCVDGGVILVWGDDPCMLTTSIITHPVIATHSITCPPPPNHPRSAQHACRRDTLSGGAFWAGFSGRLCVWTDTTHLGRSHGFPLHRSEIFVGSRGRPRREGFPCIVGRCHGPSESSHP